MNLQHNKNAGDQQYNIGDEVLLYNPRSYKGVSKELVSKWYGPYVITKQTGPLNYEIQKVNNAAHTENAHVSRLKPYYDADDLVPDILYQDNDHNDFYPINKVLNHSTGLNGDIQMQVQVEGIDDAIWVSEDELPLALLQDYYQPGQDPNPDEDFAAPPQAPETSLKDDTALPEETDRSSKASTEQQSQQVTLSTATPPPLLKPR